MSEGETGLHHVPLAVQGIYGCSDERGLGVGKVERLVLDPSH